MIREDMKGYYTKLAGHSDDDFILRTNRGEKLVEKFINNHEDFKCVFHDGTVTRTGYCEDGIWRTVFMEKGTARFLFVQAGNDKEYPYSDVLYIDSPLMKITNVKHKEPVSKPKIRGSCMEIVKLDLDKAVDQLIRVGYAGTEVRKWSDDKIFRTVINRLKDFGLSM